MQLWAVLTVSQKCKDLAITNIIPSQKRTAAFIKFLLTISKADNGPTSTNSGKAGDELEGLDQGNGRSQQPDPIFRRVHVLYIMHDILAFMVLRSNDDAHAGMPSFNPASLAQIQASIPTLARLAVCSNSMATSVSQSALEIVQSLLVLWTKHRMLPADVADDLKPRLTEANDMKFSALLTEIGDEDSQAALALQRAKEEETKWIMPATHHLPHDPTPPWHDLPAANGLYQKRTQGFPLHAASLPQGGYRLPHAGHKADEYLQREVLQLLSEATHCFDKYTDVDSVEDIDPLGNIIWKVETGRKRRNHFGWSYEGIEQRRQKLDDNDFD